MWVSGSVVEFDVGSAAEFGAASAEEFVVGLAAEFGAVDSGWLVGCDWVGCD